MELLELLIVVAEAAEVLASQQVLVALVAQELLSCLTLAHKRLTAEQ
jgi:hypothetical protein